MRTIQQYWLSILELFWNYFGTSRNDGLVRTARIMGYNRADYHSRPVGHRILS